MKRAFTNFALLVAVPVSGATLNSAWLAAQEKTLLRTNPPQELVNPTQPDAPVLQDRPDNVRVKDALQGHNQEHAKKHDRNHASDHHSQQASMDQLIVHCMKLASQEEVEFSKFGKEKSSNPEVKAFADLMIREHSEALKSLPEKFGSRHSTHLTKDSDTLSPTVRERLERANRLAGATDPIDNNLGENPLIREPVEDGAIEVEVLKPAVRDPLLGDSNAQPREPRNQQPTRPQNQTGSQEGGAPLTTSTPPNQEGLAHANSNEALLNLQTEIAQQCLEDAKAKLSKESGETFDASFIGFQIAMHQSTKSKLKVFERHATPEVKPIVENAIKKTEMHLVQAENLMAKLSKEHSAQ